jgi:hypothetical protein
VGPKTILGNAVNLLNLPALERALFEWSTNEAECVCRPLFAYSAKTSHQTKLNCFAKDHKGLTGIALIELMYHCHVTGIVVLFRGLMVAHPNVSSYRLICSYRPLISFDLPLRTTTVVILDACRLLGTTQKDR